jgi:hypothetical protein
MRALRRPVTAAPPAAAMQPVALANRRMGVQATMRPTSGTASPQRQAAQATHRSVDVELKQRGTSEEFQVPAVAAGLGQHPSHVVAAAAPTPVAPPPPPPPPAPPAPPAQVPAAEPAPSPLTQVGPRHGTHTATTRSDRVVGRSAATSRLRCR